MTIVCQSCSTRLQIEDDKVPAGAFTVRCPKCKAIVNASASSPPADHSALAVGGSPATDHPRYDQPTAPVYQISKPETPLESPLNEDALRTLLNLFGKGGPSSSSDPTIRPSWSQRKALVCTPVQYRESIARTLAESEYEVYVAEDTRQAIETMRANQMELVLLEAQFDSAEQGGAFVVREINVLRPAQRRRLFFVLISPSLRTMDAHAAFLSNVNCVVNINDLGDLPKILDIALREYNEMYREINLALSLTAL